MSNLDAICALKRKLNSENDLIRDLISYYKEKEKNKKRRECQSIEYFAARNLRLKGHYNQDFDDLCRNPRLFRDTLRMELKTFYYILDGIKSKIEKSSIRAICPEERLYITIRFLAFGGSYVNLETTFRIERTTIGKIIIETLEAIWNTFWQIHMPVPTKEQLEESANLFFKKTKFPNCVAAIDAKHFPIKNFEGAGHAHHNRKGTKSVNVQACVDSRYRFLAVEASGYGSQSDAGLFCISSVGHRLENFKFNMPGAKQLPGSSIVAPHIILGDKGYPLRSYLLKPFVSNRELSNEEKLFNSKLNSSRRFVEQAFGQVNAQFRYFKSPSELPDSKVNIAIVTAFLLHNLIIDYEKRIWPEVDLDNNDYSSRDLIECNENSSSNQNNNQTRDKFVRYFSLKN